jgi:hypothetical protein
MREAAQSRLASVLGIVLGAWAMLSPIWISVTGKALTNLLIVGAVIIVMGIAQLLWENSFPSWIMGLAAVWLFISAFAFSVSNAMAWNEALSAIIAFVIATWDGVEIRQVHHHHSSVT